MAGAGAGAEAAAPPAAAAGAGRGSGSPSVMSVSRPPSSGAASSAAGFLGQTAATTFLSAALDDVAARATPEDRAAGGGGAPAAPVTAAESVEDARAQPKPLPHKPLVLRCEEKAEEWHFDEDAHAAKLATLRRECDGYRAREKAAREREKTIKEESEATASEALGAAHDSDVATGAELARLRSELMGIEADTDHLREATQQEVIEIEQQMRNERRRQDALQEELRQERRQADVSRRKVQDIEDREAEAVRAIDDELRRRREDAQRQVLQVHREADEEIRRIDRQLREDIAAVQSELEEVLRQTRIEVVTSINERHTTLDVADAEVSKRVDSRVRHELSTAHGKVLRAREDAIREVKECQARDFALEGLLRDTADAAMLAVGCAAEEAHHAAVYDHENRQRARDATLALGEKFPRSTQFAVKLDGRVRSALKASGALAVLAGPSASPMPSPGRIGAAANEAAA